jgi:CrcB protein
MLALGAALGAPARFALDSAITARAGSRLPWGTITVNLTGSAVFGLLAGLSSQDAASAVLLALVGTGFCGAFTTFSTFTWETLALVEDGLPARAVGNVVVSIVLGVALAAAAFGVGASW